MKLTKRFLLKAGLNSRYYKRGISVSSYVKAAINWPDKGTPYIRHARIESLYRQVLPLQLANLSVTARTHRDRIFWKMFADGNAICNPDNEPRCSEAEWIRQTVRAWEEVMVKSCLI